MRGGRAGRGRPRRKSPPQGGPPRALRAARGSRVATCRWPAPRGRWAPSAWLPPRGRLRAPSRRTRRRPEAGAPPRERGRPRTPRPRARPPGAAVPPHRDGAGCTAARSRTCPATSCSESPAASSDSTWLTGTSVPRTRARAQGSEPATIRSTDRTLLGGPAHRRALACWGTGTRGTYRCTARIAAALAGARPACVRRRTGRRHRVRAAPQPRYTNGSSSATSRSRGAVASRWEGMSSSAGHSMPTSGSS